MPFKSNPILAPTLHIGLAIIRTDHSRNTNLFPIEWKFYGALGYGKRIFAAMNLLPRGEVAHFFQISTMLGFAV